MMLEKESISAWEQALDLFPGGVNSPVRAFKNVDSRPFFVKEGQGAILSDLDGNDYIDYVLSWGPLVLGHAHPEVQAAVVDSLKNGWSYGAPCLAETQLANKVKELVPSMEMMRFVSSGTEAAMGAIRLARGTTGRDLIIKTDGGYHGHSDGLLVSAGSGLATLGTSSSAGVPQAFADTTIVITLNDLKALETAFEQYPERIAAFILEPVSGNVGVIPPLPGYLEQCKLLCEKHGAMLIFDEVMCGFRASLGGAQAHYGVTPDITVLGKVIGGGFPVGAYGTKKSIMDQIAPNGPVYQAGTLSGNPVAMTAGLKTLELLQNGGHQKASDSTDFIVKELKAICQKHHKNYQVQHVGTMFSLFLCEGPIHQYQDVCKVDKKVFANFHRLMLEKGVYLAPSPFEASFLSSAHTQEHIEQTLEAFNHVIPLLP